MRESRRLVSKLASSRNVDLTPQSLGCEREHFSRAEECCFVDENAAPHSHFDFASDFATFLSFGGSRWPLVSP